MICVLPYFGRMKVFLVGGAVRDQLLGIADAHTEKDWLVVGGSVDEMLSLGYLQVGKDFPVFLHPDTHEEYALARLERKVAAGYHGFKFNTNKAVTLKQDLSRRDLTINAIAERGGKLFDPFAGRADLDAGLLRHVSDAFSEDPVRILRVARFAAKFKPFGFRVAHTTHQLMQKMTASGEVDSLAPERVFKELEKALCYETPSAFFKVLAGCGAFAKVFPMLKNPTQKTHANNFLLLDHLQTNQAIIKFAIWLKDESDENINALCTSLKCPKKYQQLALLNAQFYPLAEDFLNRSSAEILNFLDATDALRQKLRFADLLAVFSALTLDVTPIVKLVDLLRNIDVATLDKANIVEAIKAQKTQIITSFLNPTK